MAVVLRDYAGNCSIQRALHPKKDGIGFQPNTLTRRDTKPCTKKRILLIGCTGSGKSSFINSVYMAVYGEYIERARCGSGSARPITKAFKKYDLSQVEDEPIREVFSKEQLPVLFELSLGICNPFLFKNKNRIFLILRAVLRGRLPVGTNVHDLISDVEAEIPECDGEPIDRVFFVASAIEPLSGDYCDLVRKACEEEFGADFSVFGILTHADHLGSDQGNMGKQSKPSADSTCRFVQMLQAEGTEYKVLVLKNYCSTVCRGSPRQWPGREDIDGPILEFLAEICRPEYDTR